MAGIDSLICLICSQSFFRELGLKSRAKRLCEAQRNSDRVLHDISRNSYDSWLYLYTAYRGVPYGVSFGLRLKNL